MTNFFQAPPKLDVSQEFIQEKVILVIQKLLDRTVTMSKASPSGANVQASNLLEKGLKQIQSISKQELTLSSQPRF